MTNIARSALAAWTLATLAACAVPANDNVVASDATPNTAGKRAATNPAPLPPSPRPPIQPSPWQPGAEVDPVPPPVEGDDPAR